MFMITMKTKVDSLILASHFKPYRGQKMGEMIILPLFRMCFTVCVPKTSAYTQASLCLRCVSQVCEVCAMVVSSA